MAEDQERILCDEVVKLEEVVARLMDQDEENVKSIAAIADAVNKMAVRMTKNDVSIDLLTSIVDDLSKLAAEYHDRLCSLEGKGNGNGTETRNEPTGGGVVRDDGGELKGAGQQDLGGTGFPGID